ncbi:hypothetical protein H5410_030057 [Solanum commersonii]|uniref:Uncharacterized protein n=1 Tax=Solanum commersonii TaxID=4109 RepID=A0A9J5YFT5_SOLCO|nr:hypothetical protein H5410_030057 [Solanum commersonii]
MGTKRDMYLLMSVKSQKSKGLTRKVSILKNGFTHSQQSGRFKQEQLMSFLRTKDVNWPILAKSGKSEYPEGMSSMGLGSIA